MQLQLSFNSTLYSGGAVICKLQPSISRISDLVFESVLHNRGGVV